MKLVSEAMAMHEYRHHRLVQEAGMTFLEFLEARKFKINVKRVEQGESRWTEISDVARN